MNHNQASSLDHEEVACALKTDLLHGLTSFEARERLKRYGFNCLIDETKSKIVPRYLYDKLLEYCNQFYNPMIQLLFLCAIISLAIGDAESAISVTISIVIVCSISYIQERRADRSLEKLNKQMPNMCKVLREGQIHEIESKYLVPGDIVYLSEGQRVPADVRLFDLHSLTINEANLTGETQSQSKIENPSGKRLSSVLKGGSVQSDETSISIFQNLALVGTTIESGHSKGIVVCTGKFTRYGEVLCMLKNTAQPRSPLQVNIDQLSVHLVICSCVIVALISIVGIVQQRKPLEVIYYAISLAVTAIPEGLPVVVAVIMALGITRLSHQKAIVKSLNSIETLGCIQVLCADKTGTLTRDDMTLTDIITSELHSLSSAELEELNNEECKRQMTFDNLGGKMFSIGRCMEVGTLCNNANYDPSPTGLHLGGSYIGQATECAILDAANRLGFGDSRTKFDRISETPFSPSSRRMVVQSQRRDIPGNPMYYVKGAWEEILNDCVNYYESGLVKPKTDEMWLEYARICTALGSQGLRVLALATGPSMDQLTFVGAIGINNAPRDGISQTISKLQDDFHIDVKMITGDSKSTAIAIGRRLGLIGGSLESEADKFVMSGEQIQNLIESDVSERSKAKEIASKSVFYRVDPIQKANIIGKLQELDKIVAMTGDGINDVISLKRANLSLVMGSGADVCKDIADIVIVDDDLSILTQAIIEGKGIYHRIHSFMSYQISISLSLLLLVAISFALRIEPPFTVTQLLFINILADGPPAQSLGAEKVDEKELSLWPRNVHDSLISCRLMGTVLMLSATLLCLNGSLYFYLLQDDDSLDIHARTIIFTCFIFCSMFSAISLRSKLNTVFETKMTSNKELFICFIFVILFQIAILNCGFLNEIFKVEPITSLEVIYLFLYSALILIIMDTFKISIRFIDYVTRYFREMRAETKETSSKLDVP